MPQGPNLSFAEQAQARVNLGLTKPGDPGDRHLVQMTAGLAHRYDRVSVISIIGDSITSGYGLSSPFTENYGKMLENILRKRYTLPSTALGARGFLDVQNPAWAWTGGSLSLGWGPTGQYRFMNGAGQQGVLSVTGATHVDLLTGANQFGGTGTWKVDAGGTTALNYNNGGAMAPVVTRITIPDTGAHTITVAWSTAGNLVTGAIEYNGDQNSGIVVIPCGITGYKCSDWNTLYGGTGVLIDTMNPDLIVIMLGVNDGNSKSAATFKSDLLTLIAYVKARFTTPPPILLVGAYSVAGKIEPWANYIQVLADISATDVSIGYLDLNARMPATTGNPYNLYQGDFVHPAKAGAVMIADAIANFLAPR